MSDIAKAVADAIRSNQEAAIGAFTVVLGWLLGIVSTVVYDAWKERGKFSFTIVGMLKRGAPDWNEVEQFVFEAVLRVLNEYPVEKSLTIQSMSFYAERPRRWSKAEPLFTDPAAQIGYGRKQIEQDVHLPPHLFSRVYISGMTDHPPKPGDKEKIAAIRWVCVEFLLSPGTVKTCWFGMGKATDFEDEPALDALQRKRYFND